MAKVIICIPSELPGGLDAVLSESLEESAVYNFIEIDEGEDPQAILASFQRFSCHGVACLDPIEAIAKKGVRALIVRSISPNYLIRFIQNGVRVFLSSNRSVSNAAESFMMGKMRELNKSDFSKLNRK